MSCIHASHDHADSFVVVVSVASVACSDLLLSDRTLRGDVSNDKFFDNVLQASPFLSTHLTLLLSLALYSSLVSRCFVRVTCPIHLFILSKAIEPSIHPINRVLVVELALRVVGMFRLF
jgi:hypothetical protein